MDPNSWLPIPLNSQLSLANIPFGIVSTSQSETRVAAVAIGDSILNLSTFSEHDGFSALPSIQPHLSVFFERTLNAFAQLGRAKHQEVRQYLRQIFLKATPFPEKLRDAPELQKLCLFTSRDVTSHLPVQIGHYTDFYAGINHAVNAGVILRGQDGKLKPNYLNLPVAYHSRASSIVVSGVPVKRPWGQILVEGKPTMSPTRALDFELELGAILCRANDMGQSVAIDDAEDAIFGYVLLNDWSARDIQQWEAFPLGPFNGKNFATAISAWVVLVDALEPFRCPGFKNTNGDLLPYLQQPEDKKAYDLHLRVDITSHASLQETTVCKVNVADALVWSFPQFLAHHTLGGCPMDVGDLLGSGTVSGTNIDELGCLLERNINGKRHVSLGGNEQRQWLEDGDTVTLRGWAGDQQTGLVGFGDCTNTIVQANQ